MPYPQLNNWNRVQTEWPWQLTAAKASNRIEGMEELLTQLEQAIVTLREAQPQSSLWYGDAATSCSKALRQIEAELMWLKFQMQLGMN